MKVGLEEWEVIFNSISWSSSWSKLDNSTYSRAQILSFIFWVTRWSNALARIVASYPGLPGICGGNEDAVMLWTTFETSDEDDAEGCSLTAVNEAIIAGTL